MLDRRLGERKNLARVTSLGYEFLAEDSFVLGRRPRPAAGCDLD